MKKRILSLFLVLLLMVGLMPASLTADAPETASAPVTAGGVLLVRANASSGNSITLTWNKISGATSYAVYGAACGSNKAVELKTLTGRSLTVKKIDKKTKIRAGETYKFYVAAKDGGKLLSRSEAIHVISGNTTRKNGNVKSVKANKAAMTLGVGDTEKIRVTTTVYGGKEHISASHGAALRYYSSDESVAAVSKSGAVKGVKAGKATIYAQDVGGQYCAVEVTVKKSVEKTFTVKFNTQGHGAAPDAIKNVKKGAKISKPTAPKADGYTFGGWYLEKSCKTKWNFSKDTVTKDITLYAKWTVVKPDTFTVKFDAQGHGAAPSAIKNVKKGAKISKPTTPRADGYTFGGWYLEKSCKTKWNFSRDTVTGNITLYAKWTVVKPDTFTVKFDAQGHGTAPDAIENVEKGAKIDEPAAPTEAGYGFEGWYKEAACETAWNFSEDIVTQDITLYAKWIRLYTVTFDAQGHGTAPDPIGDLHSGDLIAKPDDPAETGYTFGGWYREAACMNEWDFDSDTVTDDITLYAMWTVNTYTVTFDANGRGTAPDPLTGVEYNSLISGPTDPTAAGYVFTGWFIDNACATAWDFDVDTVTDNLTLYAGWTAAVYSIRMDANGGSKDHTVLVTMDSSNVLNYQTVTKTDCVLAGWNTKADESGLCVINAAGSLKKSAGQYTDANGLWVYDIPTGQALTLYAIWKAPAKFSDLMPSNFPASGWKDATGNCKLCKDGSAFKFTSSSPESSISFRSDITLNFESASGHYIYSDGSIRVECVMSGSTVTSIIWWSSGYGDTVELKP